MAELVVKEAEKWFRREDGQPFKVIDRLSFAARGGCVTVFDRPVGLRQIDSAQFHRGAGAARPRRIAVHRPRPTPVTSSHRLRISEPALAAVENHWREHQPRPERRRTRAGATGSTGFATIWNSSGWKNT